jgi:hypothetical protein
VDDAVKDRLDLPRERRLADDALVEDDPERVDVRTAVEGSRGDLLGREVGDGADERARLGQPRLGRRVREAEIHDPDADGRALFPADHHVGRLDVPVHHAARMAVVESVGHLDADVHDLAQRERPLADQVRQVRPGDERHDEEERTLVPPEVVDRDDRGVVHLRDNLSLAGKPLFQLGRQISRRDQLDGDVAVQAGVSRPVDDAHSPAAELALDLVPLGEPGVNHALLPS